MRTFSINTLGCKVNQYESQQIRQFLESYGLTHITNGQKPELCIINTCCVTHIASAKSRQCIHRSLKAYPEATFIICGCLPYVNIGEINDLFEKSNVLIIRNQKNLVGTLTQFLAEKCKEIKDKLPEMTELPQLSSFWGQTRAFLKIQDGCDGSCSYCIIPKARPIVQSKPVEQVIKEAQAIVNAGHKEIVVTGIHIGSFGQETVKKRNWLNSKNDRLSDLLGKIAKIGNLKRIRLSSIEPGDVTEKLLDTISNNRNIMPHIHLSIQSGSDSILKMMCRQYTVDDCIKAVELIRSTLDRPAVTGDLIVGFPGETDKDFEKTVELTKVIKFSKIHVFRFSPRKGTAAYNMKPKVQSQVARERSQILRCLDKQLGSQYREQFIGQEQEILTESDSAQEPGWVSGRTERYFFIKVKQQSRCIGKNQLIKVIPTENREDCMTGRLVALYCQ